MAKIQKNSALNFTLYQFDLLELFQLGRIFRIISWNIHCNLLEKLVSFVSLSSLLFHPIQKEITRVYLCSFLIMIGP